MESKFKVNDTVVLNKVGRKDGNLVSYVGLSTRKIVEIKEDTSRAGVKSMFVGLEGLESIKILESTLIASTGEIKSKDTIAVDYAKLNDMDDRCMAKIILEAFDDSVIEVTEAKAGMINVGGKWYDSFGFTHVTKQ